MLPPSPCAHRCLGLMHALCHSKSLHTGNDSCDSVRPPFPLHPICPPIPTDKKSPLMILIIHLSLRLRPQITIHIPRFNSNIPVFQYSRPTITSIMLEPRTSQPAEFKGPATDTGRCLCMWCYSDSWPRTGV
ncbi:hypothetical protein FIBSPDRAFT_481188 [Athelia psychrophila]|uniref:Uncharacterized protein n=1 Tax=Athelia psychrophila TaxID=1759441 RepID=A0A166VFL2_9AGAM|nr:hypothetical protein FIBSPDRAFT_481188 [Fibularhizoctonia sp. CBS 109695]